MTDQLSELESIVAANPFFDAQGATFTIAGDFVPPDGSTLLNLNLVQLDQTSSRRTLKKTSGYGLRLRNVTIDRGPDKTLGSMSDSAGVWVSGVADVDIDGLEITGNGPGSGIRLIGLTEMAVRNVWAHDMAFACPTNPGSEQIVNVWIENCSKSRVISGIRTDRTYAHIGSDTPRCFQNDGITVSGCSDLVISDISGSDIGEGIDITGGIGNKRIVVHGVNYLRPDSFGIKLANSAQGCVITGFVVTEPGFSGAVISGPSVAGLPDIQDNMIANGIIFDPGNQYWGATNPGSIMGACILNNSSIKPSWPQRNTFDNILCIETRSGSSRRMQYSFRNENNNTTNVLTNSCRSIGHIVGRALGTWG